METAQTHSHQQIHNLLEERPSVYQKATHGEDTCTRTEMLALQEDLQGFTGTFACFIAKEVL
ncbi:MAG: hypothetical protein ACPGWR_11105 [Ardenticatenaceae bacterium]